MTRRRGGVPALARPAKSRQDEWKGETPPHDTLMEGVSLGCMLAAPVAEGAGRLLPHLDADLYFDPAHQVIFTAIREVALRGDQPSVLSVAQQLASQDQLDGIGGSATLRALANEWGGQPLHPLETARYLDHYRLQRIAIEIKLSALEPTGQETIARMYERLRDAQRPYVPLARTAAEIAVDVIKEYERGADADMIPTGLYSWDRYLGGLRRKSFYVIGALTGVGKTALGLRLTRGIAERGHQGLILSLEMEDTRLFKRMLADVAGVENWRTARGRFDVGEWEVIPDHIRTVATLPWIVRDAHASLSEHLTALLSLCLQFPNIAAIVVDYLGLLEQHVLPYEDETRARFLDKVSGGLKILAKRTNTAVIALCQLKRDAEKAGEPVLSDLRESGGIAAAADGVVLIDVKAQRDKKQSYRSDEPQVLDAFIRKNRDGPTEHMQFRWEPKYQRITDDTEPVAAPWEGGEAARGDRDYDDVGGY